VGEITEALQRARRERERKPEAPPVSARPGISAAEAQREQAPAGLDAAPRSRTILPTERRGFWQARAAVLDAVGPVAEGWRQIALQVRRALDRRSERSVLITSSLRAEGKTLTACNLALALATVAAGRRVALVDLDLRRPAVAHGLGVEPQEGIEDVLAGSLPLASACVPIEAADLDVYPVASPVAEAHRLLSGDRLPDLLAELERRYALVVCDTPPVLPVPDVSLIAPHVGACLLVTRSGVTRRNVYEQMLGLIPEGKALGTLLNDVTQSRRGRYDYDGYAPRAHDE